MTNRLNPRFVYKGADDASEEDWDVSLGVNVKGYAVSKGGASLLSG